MCDVRQVATFRVSEKKVRKQPRAFNWFVAGLGYLMQYCAPTIHAKIKSIGPVRMLTLAISQEY